MTPFEPLGLTHVLADTLPTSLGTDTAPDRYQVDAILNRRATPDEIAAIHDDDTRDVLTTAGYGAVGLRLDNRRLEISETNIAELNAGLATTIADRLAELSERLEGVRSTAADAAQVVAQTQQERAAAVVALANGVSFARSVA